MILLMDVYFFAGNEIFVEIFVYFRPFKGYSFNSSLSNKCFTKKNSKQDFTKDNNQSIVSILLRIIVP